MLPPQITLADGRTLRARVLATDSNADLAALAVVAGGLPAIAHTASWRLRPGHWVLALGHPWGMTGAAAAGMVIDVGPPTRAVALAGRVNPGWYAPAAWVFRRSARRRTRLPGRHQYHDGWLRGGSGDTLPCDSRLPAPDVGVCIAARR